MGVPVRYRGDRGATSVEYGLIASLIAVVILIGVFLLGQNVFSLFDTSASQLDQAAAAP